MKTENHQPIMECVKLSIVKITRNKRLLKV